MRRNRNRFEEAQREIDLNRQWLDRGLKVFLVLWFIFMTLASFVIFKVLDKVGVI